MNQKPLELGILGLGKAGLRHVAAAVASDAVRLVGVADPADAAREAIGKRPPYRVFRRLDDLIAAGVEAVIIAVPHGSLADAAVRALQAGLHVLLEKPMANTVDDAKRILAAAERSGTSLMVNFNHRFRDEYRTAKRWLEEGRIGRPRFVVEHLLAAAGPLPAWVWDPAVAGGGMMTYSGIHMIDHAMWLLDERVSAVTAASAHLHFDQTLEDTTVASLRFTDGALATLVQHKSNVAHGQTTWETRVFGTEGAIHVVSGRSAALSSPAGEETATSDRDRRFLEALEAFATTIRQRRPASPDGATGLAVLACLKALYRAAESPGWVRV